MGQPPHSINSSAKRKVIISLLTIMAPTPMLTFHIPKSGIGNRPCVM